MTTVTSNRKLVRDEPLDFYIFRADYRLYWCALIGGCDLLAAMMLLSGVLSLIHFGIFFVAGWAFYAFFIFGRPLDDYQLSLITWTYRRFKHRLRENLHFTRRPGGRPFEEPRPIRQIGKVYFGGHTVRESRLGVARDLTNRTFSATLLVRRTTIHGKGPEAEEELLRSYRHVLDHVPQRVVRLGIREQIFSGETIDTAAMVDKIRTVNGSKSRGTVRDSSELEKFTQEMASSSMVHRTTITLAIRPTKQELKKRIAEEVLLSAVHQMSKGLMRSTGFESVIALSEQDLILENLLALDPIWTWPLVYKPRPQLKESDALPDVLSENAGHWHAGSTHHIGYYINDYSPDGMPPKQYAEVVSKDIPMTGVLVFEWIPRRLALSTAKKRKGAIKGVNNWLRKTGRPIHADREQMEIDADNHERDVSLRRGEDYRCVNFLIPYGDSLEQVKANAGRIQMAVDDASFLIRPMTDVQAVSIGAVMPLARGLDSE